MKDFIDVRRITKQYETAKALNNVSLTIPEGSLAAIVGKSGCGKTTLLNMIGGLDTPSCGEGRVPGAIRIGSVWGIPEDAEKPADARIKNGKYIKQKSE